MARPVGPRNTIVFAIGVVMMALGAYVVGHPLWSGGRPITDARLLDGMLALFFLVRGWMNVRTATGRPPFGARRP